jgi:outer membrane protein OmpA-like peptidoglycan-associated protein
MSDRDDEQTLGIALLVVFAAIAVAVATAIAVAVMHGRGKPADATAPLAGAAGAGTAMLARNAPDLATMRLFGRPQDVLYFELGRNSLPADAEPVIDRALKAANARPGVKVVLSGYHDATGDADRNAELARLRAQAVRTALIDKGLDPSRIVLRKPETARDDGPAREARRVELRMVEAP